MTIDKYYLTVCRKCFLLHGYVEERYNGKVPVLCFCDLSENPGKTTSPSIMAGYWGQKGEKEVKLHWQPTSDYKNENGDYIHVPYFAGMRIGSGKPDYLEILLEWVVEKNKL